MGRGIVEGVGEGKGRRGVERIGREKEGMGKGRRRGSKEGGGWEGVL